VFANLGKQAEFLSKLPPTILIAMNFFKRPIDEMPALGAEQYAKYSSASPFPHIVMDDFFDASALRTLLDEFPELGKEAGDINYVNPNESKFASKGEGRLGPGARELVHLLNSQPFLEYLQNLTGIKETLIPDPDLEGGGYHPIVHAANGNPPSANTAVLQPDWREMRDAEFAGTVPCDCFGK
jgi:hypothetical protein